MLSFPDFTRPGAVLAILASLAAAPAGWALARLARAFDPAGAAPRTAPMVALAAVVFAWATLATPAGPILAISLGLGAVLICLAAIDLVALRLPDALTLPLALAGLAVSALLLPGRPWLDHLVGAAGGYGLLALLAFAYERLRRAEGIGLGDAKLLGAAGAWLGWSPLPSALLIACLAAFAWIALRRLAGRRVMGDERLAFGAPLCLAIWIVWLYGPLVT